jgi:hypothetical protein
MAAHASDMSSDIVYIFDRLEERYLSVNERGEIGPSEKTRPELIRHYSTKGSLADETTTDVPSTSSIHHTELFAVAQLPLAAGCLVPGGA